MKSVLQTKPVREQGDYEMINVDSFVSFIQEQGYNLSSKDSYQEQDYRLKTIIRETANHGQYRLNFERAGSNLGLVVFSSTDTQLPFSLYAGLRLNNGDVLPMVKVLSVKHLKNQIDSINSESLSYEIKKAISELDARLKELQTIKVHPQTVLEIFQQTNKYKQSLMKCLSVNAVHSVNEYQLFGNLIAGFIYGQGISETGRKIKEVKHLRRHIQLTQYITNFFL